jgi:CRP/FNR family transcriptional regulator, cyclic AMP receptor protein
MHQGSGIGTRVALLDVDLDLADVVDADDLVRARRTLVASALAVAPGPWTPAKLLDRAVGLLVLDGAILREVQVDGALATELMGAGDVLVPVSEEPQGTLVGVGVRWSALLTSRLGILDASLVKRMGLWPQLLDVILRRMGERSARQAVAQAICQSRRVAVRLRGMLWHLADRWGRVTLDGVVLPLPLTHQRLADLIGAQRPTVTTALTALHEGGEIRRRRDGAWLLRSDSRDLLEECDRQPATARPALELLGHSDGTLGSISELIERAQKAGEQHSLSVMGLRRRCGELGEASATARRFVAPGGSNELLVRTGSSGGRLAPGDLDDVVAQGENERLELGMHAQLGEDVVDVIANRPNGYV